MSNVLEELKTRKQQVEYILENYPATRENDFYLSLMWLKIFGGLSVSIPFIPWDEIKKVGGKVDAAIRVRRIIQNVEKRYLPSLETQERRAKRSGKFRDAIGKRKV